MYLLFCFCFGIRVLLYFVGFPGQGAFAWIFVFYVFCLGFSLGGLFTVVHDLAVMYGSNINIYLP